MFIIFISMLQEANNLNDLLQSWRYCKAKTKDRSSSFFTVHRKSLKEIAAEIIEA